jgi:hypothetical protein
VLDSSVAIDFQEGSFLAPLFALPVQFVVPDILLDQEFLTLDRGQLLALGLHIASLNGNQLIEVITLRQQHPPKLISSLAVRSSRLEPTSAFSMRDSSACSLVWLGMRFDLFDTSTVQL